MILGLVWFVCWQVAVATSMPRRTVVSLALYGFVFHVIFGKAYSLVPSYFERTLVSPWGPRLQLPFVGIGTPLLALEPWLGQDLAGIGAILWGLGVAIFVGTILVTVRTNLTGAATGTGEANAERRRVDRLGNAVVPVALAYLVLGAYETVAVTTALPTLTDGLSHQATHLLAAGTATLLVFGIGSRLLPRFFVSRPPTVGVIGMVLAGAIGPALIVVGFARPRVLHLGGGILLVGLLSYAIVVGTLAWRRDRGRIGLYGVAMGAIGAVAGGTVGLLLAISVLPTSAVSVHYRLTLLGFLGLTVTGVLFQFYPPGIGGLPGISNRWAGIALGGLGSGLVLEVLGWAVRIPTVTTLGSISTVGGAVLVAWIVIGITIKHGT